MVKSFAFFFVEQFTLARLYHIEIYCIWSKWQAENINTDSEETANTHILTISAFSIVLSHTKCPFKAQTVQLQIWDQF